MNILILGSTGYIGRKLANYFKREHNIITSARNSKNIENNVDIVFENLESFEILNYLITYKIILNPFITFIKIFLINYLFLIKEQKN